MSAASSTRSLLAAVPSFRSVASSSRVRYSSTYVPRGARNTDDNPRPPRPVSPSYFTGKPQWGDAMTALETTVTESQAGLRQAHVWPLPAELPHLIPPAASWKSWEDLKRKDLPMRAKGDYRALVGVLNQLNHLRQIAILTGSHDIADKISAAVQPYEHSERVTAAAAAEEARRKSQQDGSGIDALGRAYALGRRKASSARVWIVPTAQARELFAAESGKPAAETAAEAEAEAEETAFEVPKGEILINHLPLPQHFLKPADREAVLRPLRVTGLLGAFNIFALVRGGGSTGQSGAVALGIARALTILRKEATPVLINDNALWRDTRRVERKKTNRLKARKARTWVKR